MGNHLSDLGHPLPFITLPELAMIIISMPHYKLCFSFGDTEWREGSIIACNMKLSINRGSDSSLLAGGKSKKGSGGIRLKFSGISLSLYHLYFVIKEFDGGLRELSYGRVRPTRHLFLNKYFECYNSIEHECPKVCWARIDR